MFGGGRAFGGLVCIKCPLGHCVCFLGVLVRHLGRVLVFLLFLIGVQKLRVTSFHVPFADLVLGLVF